MNIIYIRYTLFRYPDIHQTHLLEILTSAPKATLQHKSILSLRHTLRHWSGHHLHELIPGNRQRLIHYLNIVLILLRLHPRYIPLIRTLLNLTIQHKIIPERMEMNQHLPQRLLLQLLLRPPPVIHIIPRIQMLILRIIGIQILINAELLILHNQFQSHLLRQQANHFLYCQKPLQLARQSIRLPIHLLTEPPSTLLLLKITAEPLHHRSSPGTRILLQRQPLQHSHLERIFINLPSTLQQIQEHLTQHKLIPVYLLLQPGIKLCTWFHRTILGKSHHRRSIHHQPRIKDQLSSNIIPHLKPQRSLTTPHIQLLEQNNLKHNTILL